MTDPFCAKCGACTTVCPVFQVTGKEFLTARGRLHLLDKLQKDTKNSTYGALLSQCLLCGACEAFCPQGLDITRRIATARQQLAWFHTDQALGKYLTAATLNHASWLAKVPALSSGLARFLELLPPESGLRRKLVTFSALEFSASKLPALTEQLRNSGEEDLLYFPGCLANHFQADIGHATAELAEHATGKKPAVPKDVSCCGLAAYTGGSLEAARQAARTNISALASSKAAPILTSCASCYSHLRSYPSLFETDDPWHDKAGAFAERVLEFSTWLADQSRFMEILNRTASRNSPSRRVLYHDPCHLRFHCKITDPPRQLLNAVPDITPVEAEDGSRCCGMGGLFQLAHQELSASILTGTLTGYNALVPDIVTTTCSGCLLQLKSGFRKTQSDCEVVHLSLILRRCL